MASCSGTTIGMAVTTCPATACCSRHSGQSSGRGWSAPWPSCRPRDCSAAWPDLPMAALLLLPPEERTLRSGVALYALVSIVAFVVATPVGGNMARLGALAAGPVLALGLVGRRRTVALAVLAVPLLYWQWVAAVRDLS